MAAISVKGLIECGVHFGHRISRWNPKMAPYIYGKRNLIHIINLRETLRGIIRGTHFLNKVASLGELILFVGTKRQAKSVILEEAKKCSMPYVSERWLGGTLTNYGIIRQRLQRLEMLESMEQDGSINLLNKKEISRLMREKRKLLRNLDGIRTLDRLPGAIIIVDPKREANAIREAYRLGIPVIAIMDTDCDPAMVDICVPANDDAMRSIQTIVSAFSEAVLTGRKAYREVQAVEEKKRAEAKEKEEASQVKFTFEGGKRTKIEPLEAGAAKKRAGDKGTGGKPSSKGGRPRKPRVAPKSRTEKQKDAPPKKEKEEKPETKPIPEKPDEMAPPQGPQGVEETVKEETKAKPLPPKSPEGEEKGTGLSSSSEEGESREEEMGVSTDGDPLKAEKGEGGGTL